jgi:tristetraprolin
MMLPGPALDNLNPALARVQQQHNVFRGSHHHSASDPLALRDAATLALINGAIPPFSPGMFPTGLAAPPGMPIYPNQFYRAQDSYPSPDPTAAAQVMAARLQSQYTGPYGMLTPQLDQALSSPTTSNGGQNGPSANNRKLGLYKTELCRSWEEKGSCRYGAKCQFAHGEDELRRVTRHPKVSHESTLA